MTINFVPGDVSGGEQSVSHGQWKNHYVIAYGSGNNVIIYVRSGSHSDVKDNIQTIYFNRDPEALDFNAKNAFIAVAIGAKIHIFKPVNEYMADPKWTEVLVIEDCGSAVNCLHWAPAEDELVVGTDTAIQLYHFYDEYGALKVLKRWDCAQPLPTTGLKITHNASKIIAKSGHYDRFLKLWTRMNYGDDNTLFEVSYLKHPVGDFVMDFRWRYREYSTTEFKVTDGSMAKIKNIRNYIDSHTEDSDTLYTFTNDKVVRVWSTFEYTGHSHIKCWGELDLSNSFHDEQVCAISFIDNYHLKKTLFKYVNEAPDSDLVRYFKDQDFDNFDLLIAISETGQVALYSVLGIYMVPPNSVTFTRINTVAMELDANCFSTIKTLTFTDEEHQDVDFIQGPEYLRNLRPIIIPKIVFLNQGENLMSLLVHDRMKNTLKLNSFNIKKMLAPNAVTLGTNLLNKFQGHDKSIRMLKKSNPFLKDENVLLSTSNFPEHNYIWEPLILTTGGIKHVTITKRFLLDLTQNTSTEHEGNRILDAVILNDIELLPGIRRHHLVITFDALGYLCLWDCNGTKYDDRPAKLIRSDLLVHDGQTIKEKPKVFSLTELCETEERKEYCLVAIFSTHCIKAWKLFVYTNDLKIEFKKTKLSELPIPQECKMHKITTLESYINEDEKNICSVIDDEGHLRLFAISNHGGSLEWVEKMCLPTNVKNASKIMGSTKINKFAIVDSTGYKLFIWDLNAQVMEYEETFPEEHGKVMDIDWCMLQSKNMSSNALLSVGFARSVLLYTELRYDYTHDTPTYSVLKKIDITDYTSHEIGDSIWINNGYLVIGCGNQFFIDDRWIGLESSPSQFLNITIRELVKGYLHENGTAQISNGDDQDLVFDLSNIVRILNGPLPLYHPQFLIQLLFMSHYKLVERILVVLFQKIRQGATISWNLEMDVLKEIQLEEKSVSKYQKLFHEQENDDVFESFGDTVADLLTEHLTKTPLPLITRHQQITLTTVVRITNLVSKHRMSMDDNGVRFLIGFRLFQSSSTQTKLSMRDINFALHSENRDTLFSVIQEAYKYRFSWPLIKRLGLVYWLDTEKLQALIEGVARNDFSEDRDPSGMVALFYLALCKKQILQGLWRTVTHPEKDKMMKFLSNDFKEKRWQTAALKNAFVLLGKHRYIDAAYFFLLADKVLDACNILIGKLNDFPLALLVAKLYCKSAAQDPVAVIRALIENYSIKRAIEKGDKWLSSWIFWEADEKEKAVQALIKAPDDIVKKSDFKYPGDVKKRLTSETFLRSDPALVLLFRSLKTRSLHYKRGSLQVTRQEEMEAVLRTVSIYTKMGCDYLALLLLRNWQFTYDEMTKKKKPEQNGFEKFKQESRHQDMQTPPPTAFEEPDMSSFDFGF